MPKNIRNISPKISVKIRNGNGWKLLNIVTDGSTVEEVKASIFETVSCLILEESAHPDTIKVFPLAR